MAKKMTPDRAPVKMMTRLIGLTVGGLFALQIAPIVPQIVPTAPNGQTTSAAKPATPPLAPTAPTTLSDEKAVPALTELPPLPSIGRYRERPSVRFSRTMPGCGGRPTREDRYMPQDCHDETPAAAPARPAPAAP